MNNSFEIKKSLVLDGNSKIFKNWSEHSNITIQEFLDSIEWVCTDPLDNGRLTREIGLTPTGIVKLRRVYDSNGLVTFYLGETLWNGAVFERQCTEKEKEFLGTDTVKEIQKISLSCRDKV